MFNKIIGDYNNAAQYLNNSLEMKNSHYEVKDNLTIANTLNNVGLCYLDVKEYDRSLAFLKKSWEIYEKINEHKNLNPISVDLLSNIGLNYYHLHNYTESIDYFKKGLQIIEKIDSANENENYKMMIKADFYSNIGSSYFEMSKYELSIDYFERAIELYDKLNSDKSKLKIKNISNKIGLSYFYTNQFGKAVEFLKK
jgi:tetratricopeptide (TPR) repeat protein